MEDTVSLTIQDVAQLLNVNPRTVYRLVACGKLPCFKVGSQWRFRRRMLDEWIQAQVAKSSRGAFHAG